jgi:succinyl-diaminopimelate desuccinylase
MRGFSKCKNQGGRRMDPRFSVTDKDLNDAIELTKTFVAIPTVSPGGSHYAEFVSCLESEIKTRVPRMQLDRHVIPMDAYEDFPEIRDAMKGDRIVLFARTNTVGKPKIHMNDHYDVVGPGDINKWNITPPFEPKLVNDRIYGRGACDPKGSIAALIEALRIIHREKRELKYDITISFTPDEEIGKATGTWYLAEQTKLGTPFIEGEFFFSVDGAQNVISIGKTGLINFEVDIEGRAGHISRSYNAVNAVHLAEPLLAGLIELKSTIERRSSDYPSDPATGLGHVRPNLSITMISGGHSTEVIPDRCLIAGSRLVLPDESPNSMADARKELVNCLLDIKLRYQMNFRFKVEEVLYPFITSQDHPAITRLREVASRGRVKGFPVALSQGPNDISWVKRNLDLPTFGRGVQTMDCNVHSYDENVPVSNIKQAIEDLVVFLTE